MQLPEFDTYNNKCPVCQKDLVLLVDVSFWMWKNRYHPLEPAGAIMYLQGRRSKKMKFRKAFISWVEAHKDVMQIIFDNAPKTFTIKDLIYPRFCKLKIKNALKPEWKLQSIDFIYEKTCVNKGHSYSYNSGVIYKNDYPAASIGLPLSQQDLFLEKEMVIIDDEIEISNFFTNGSCTSISYNGDTNTPSNGEVRLPLFPISKWDLTNKKNLIDQIEKYSILV